MTLGVRDWFQGIGESRRCAFGMSLGYADISAHPNLLFYKEGMAERTGLEPATPGVTGRYSNQLNYRSNRGGC